MGRVIRLYDRKNLCEACTDETVCVSCYLDEKHVESLEDDRELDLEGYIDG